jgi:hypothetical protein
MFSYPYTILSSFHSDRMHFNLFSTWFEVVHEGRAWAIVLSDKMGGGHESVTQCQRRGGVGVE